MAWSLGLLELGAVGAGSDCLVPSGLEGPAAFGMLAGDDAGLLLAEVTGAGGRFQEVGEGHDCVSSGILKGIISLCTLIPTATLCRFHWRVNNLISCICRPNQKLMSMRFGRVVKMNPFVPARSFYLVLVNISVPMF